MIPTSTNVSIVVKTKPAADAEAVVVFVTQGSKAADGAGAAAAAGEKAAESAARLLNAGVARGKLREVHFDLLDDRGKITRVYVAGLGPAAKLTQEVIRQAAAAVAAALARHKVVRATVVVPSVEAVDPATAAEAVVTGSCWRTSTTRNTRGPPAQEGRRRRPSGSRWPSRSSAPTPT